MVKGSSFDNNYNIALPLQLFPTQLTNEALNQLEMYLEFSLSLSYSSISFDILIFHTEGVIPW